VNATPPELPSQAARPPFRWVLFIALLLGPALLTCLTVLIESSSNGPAAPVGLIAGGLGGMASGIVLGIWTGRSMALRAVLAIAFAAVCGVVSISLAMFGCLASGFNLNLH
jgi:hypothetical protein